MAAGATGVEMAGAIAEIARYTIAMDFRRIDPRTAQIILIEAGPARATGTVRTISPSMHRSR
jgi:NADH dehydrogenase